MTPQELKISILQRAIQGKLVEQRTEEGTGEDLCLQIQSEKQALIKEGKIKKEKPLPEITEDEIPFVIPETWQWVRIRDYCTDVFSGKSPVYVKHETKYRIVGQAANQQNGLDFSQVKYTNEEFWSTMDERYFLRTNDVLLNTLGNGTLGRSGIVTNLPYSLLTDGHLFVFRFDSEVQAKYFYYYLQLQRVEIEKNANGSTNQTFLSLGKTVSWLVPIPPLAEQKRIVAKIEELLPLIDRYEQAWSKLEEFNKRFPVDMQKSILQTAIQGKLVEQRPEEGTGEELYQQIQAKKQALIKAGKIKKEKPLPEITEDEIQFDIPESWRHVRLGEVFCLEMGQSPDGNTVSEIGDGIEFHQGKVHFGKMELQFSPQKTTAPTKYAEPDSVLLCVRAPVGKVNITKRQICIGRGLCAVKPICGVSVEFVYYWLATMENIFLKKATGTTFVAVTGDVVKNQVVPLPPLAEQKRIVAKLEEILPLCERLK